MLEIVTQWLSDFYLTPLEVQATGVVATLFAVAVALSAGRRTDKRWRKDRDDRQKAQARLVTVLTHEGNAAETVAIRNDGADSILLAGVADVQPRPAGTKVSGAVQEGPGIDGRPVVGVIRPLEQAMFSVHCEDAEGDRVPWPEGRRQVTIEFMDAHGKSWRRMNLDEPEPIKRVSWAPR